MPPARDYDFQLSLGFCRKKTLPDFEQMLEDFYRGLLKPGDACIDVGAHVGRHTLPMASCVAPSGRIFAFEPLPTAAGQLRATLAATPHLGELVELEECALSETAGETDFTYVQNNPGYSGLLPRHYDTPVVTQIIRVAVHRLDDMAERMPRIRYVKIDCEGGELRVLRGARDLLRRDRPVVSFESSDAGLGEYGYSAGDIFDFWDGLGYDVRSITQQPLDRSGYVAASAQQQFWDYIAFPRV